MELNKVYHSSFLDNTLPDKSVNLLIADPPYFEVKGQFDFIWSSMDDYLKDVEKWAKECKRLLADNGTLFWWGHAKKIAYSQIILDKFFNLENSLVWENTNPHKQQIKFSEGLKTFAPLTERILMYSNEVGQTGLEKIINTPELWESIKKYFVSEFKKANLTIKKANQIMGYATSGSNVAGGLFLEKKKEFVFPTKTAYSKLQTTGFFKKSYLQLRQEYEQLRQEYEQLRQEYEQLRRPFNNVQNFGDVIRMPNYETKDYKHPTIKPEKLTRALILTCSRPNDLVFVPFSGSGTECAMAAKEGRKFIGFDIEKKYVDMANKRIKPHLQQTKLF